MTSIVYHNGKLYGDRRHVVASFPVSFIDGPKIFKSKDGQFAYGISGRSVIENNRDRLEGILRKLIEHFVVTGRDRLSPMEVLDESERDDLNLSQMIMATSDIQVYSFENVETILRVNCGEATQAVGSGGVYVNTMLRSGLTIKEVSKRIRRLDHFTGDKFDCIDTKKLKPFVVKGV